MMNERAKELSFYVQNLKVLLENLKYYNILKSKIYSVGTQI